MNSRRDHIAVLVVAALVASFLVWHVATDEPDLLLVGDSIMRQTGSALEGASSEFEIRNRAANGSGAESRRLRLGGRHARGPAPLPPSSDRDPVHRQLRRPAHRWRDDQGRPIDKNTPSSSVRGPSRPTSSWTSSSARATPTCTSFCPTAAGEPGDARRDPAPRTAAGRAAGGRDAHRLVPRSGRTQRRVPGLRARPRRAAGPGPASGRRPPPRRGAALLAAEIARVVET